MTAVVIDASAGVELVANTVRGRRLRRVIPPGSDPWVPEHFYIECAAVLRRWDLIGHAPRGKIESALAELLAWPLRVAGTHGLIRPAWSRRANLTVADGAYVALAFRLGAPLLTDDARLAGAPNLPVTIIR